jgi:hypothetical protein
MEEIALANPKENNNQRLVVILIALVILIGVGAAYLGYYYYNKQTVAEDIGIVEVEKTTITTLEKTAGKTDEVTEKTEKTAGKTDEVTEKTEKTAGKTDEVTEKTEKTAGKTDEVAEKTEKTADKTDEVADDKKGKKSNIQAIVIVDDNPLNQMPIRQEVINNPFTPVQQEVLSIPEETLAQLKSEGFAAAGKFNPFLTQEISMLINQLASQPKITIQSDQNAQTVTPPVDLNLPDIPNIPDNISFPDNTTNLPELGMITPGDIETRQRSIKNVVTNTTVAEDLLGETVLTGVIGDAAIINFGGESRALHAGQNYRGIVVLSVTPNSVTLELNNVKVIRELKD